MLYLIVLLPIGISMFILITESRFHRGLILILQFVLTGMAAKLFIDLEPVHKGELVMSLGGYPEHVGILLVADALSTLFVLLTTFLFTLLLIYALKKVYFERKFLFLFLTLESMILAIFLSGDLFNLYALIEVSTIVVSILIMYKKDRSSIYDGMVYLLTNLVSMTFFLLGVGYIYKIFGTLSLKTLGEVIGSVSDTRTLILPFAFLMTAVSLKIAAMPLFSWLPKAHGAHSAPFIVSAVLSGLYIKSSLYMFIRLNAIFGDILDTHEIFLVIGLLTALIGAYFAFRQDDLKLFLAYSTVSQIGLIVFAFSMETVFSYYGATYHILSHAIFKSTLFLGAGVIINVYGTRRMSEIKGVFQAMPFISIMLFMAVLGIIGAPFFNGSISKHLIKKGTDGSAYLEYVLMALNVGTMLYFFKFLNMFRRDESSITMNTSDEKYSREMLKIRSKVQTSVSWNQSLSIGIMGIVCLVMGLYGEFFVSLFFDLSLKLSLDDYINKIIQFSISIIVAFLFYFLLARKDLIQRHHPALELTFSELMVSIVLFFTALLGYLMIIT